MQVFLGVQVKGGKRMKRTLQTAALTESEFLEEIKRARVQCERDLKELEGSIIEQIKKINDKKRDLEKLQPGKDTCFVCKESFVVVHKGWHLLNKLKAFVVRNGEPEWGPACSITCAKSFVDNQYKEGLFDNDGIGAYEDFPTIESCYKDLDIYYCYNDRFYDYNDITK